MGPSDIALLCILLILLLFSAFFSSAETALTTVNKVRLRMLIDDGNKKAVILDKVLENSRKMLSTVLIGNNIVNIAASSLTTIFTQNVFHVSWIVSIGVGLLTLTIIIFGEIIPKTIATIHAESMALAYAKYVRFFMIILTPFIFVLNVFSSFMLKIFRVNINLNSASITEDELRTIVGVSQEEGIIEEDEFDMINNVFDFGDTCAKDIMIPKIDITMVPIDITYNELLDVIKEDKYTRMPVYKEDTDNVVGIINIKDMIINEVDNSTFDIRKLMREPYYTHEKEELNDLLIEMRNKEPGMCIVLDEYGQCEGLITLEDIVEEIIGDIHDEFDEAEEQVLRQIGDHEYIVEGSINLDDFNDQLETNIDSEDYESLGGLIIEHLDRLPNKGDCVTIDNCRLTVIKMDDKRIDLVKVVVEPKEESNLEQDNTESEITEE
ncbi:HlyC/CorC family transporter [uncultured Eubacterium sp.]|uniref:HlyC/CorC family transporter n=1 Tax=uncultured Eubacterium sp. TaxID=165185 RepID=UPI0026710BF8|nr:hemolysin family protein [uncultured Eubacterium sp.]